MKLLLVILPISWTFFFFCLNTSKNILKTQICDGKLDLTITRYHHWYRMHRKHWIWGWVGDGASSFHHRIFHRRSFRRRIFLLYGFFVVRIFRRMETSLYGNFAVRKLRRTEFPTYGIIAARNFRRKELSPYRNFAVRSFRLTSTCYIPFRVHPHQQTCFQYLVKLWDSYDLSLNFKLNLSP